jgi:hypothetical protein
VRGRAVNAAIARSWWKREKQKHAEEGITREKQHLG